MVKSGRPPKARGARNRGREDSLRGRNDREHADLPSGPERIQLFPAHVPNPKDNRAQNRKPDLTRHKIPLASASTSRRTKSPWTARRRRSATRSQSLRSHSDPLRGGRLPGRITEIHWNPLSSESQTAQRARETNPQLKPTDTLRLPISGAFDLCQRKRCLKKLALSKAGAAFLRSSQFTIQIEGTKVRLKLLNTCPHWRGRVSSIRTLLDAFSNRKKEHVDGGLCVSYA